MSSLFLKNFCIFKKVKNLRFLRGKKTRKLIKKMDNR